jgi:23S rRNA (adenine2030-N6)-methyltransferase
MNYRHAFHAGNFADVVKHLALVSILLHLRRKDSAFAVIDTHAGRGVYNLRSEAAERTGEAANGIGRILGLHERREELPEALQQYLWVAKQTAEGCYPGSPVIAAFLMRPQDRLVAIEKHEEEAAALKSALRWFRRRTLHCECADSYARLDALLPPPERRGLVLIDPPFESPDEFRNEARALAGALKRFATGIYLLWFPIKSAGDANAFCGEILATGVKKALRIDIDVGSAEAGANAKERLAAAGLIVINPPYGFAEEMQASLAQVAPLLSANARWEVRWLVGEDG